jgi:hypothetical protein
MGNMIAFCEHQINCAILRNKVLQSLQACAIKGYQQGETQMTTRSGKTAQGSHEYNISPGVTACCMGDGLWYIFRDGKDTGLDFKTLAAARKWARSTN